MTSITLLLPCHCSNENYTQCNMTAVRIDGNLVAQTKQRRAIAGVCHAQDADFVASYFWSDADFMNIGENALAEVKKGATLVVENFVVLGGKTTVPLPEMTRTDCVQMRVGVDGNIRWRAYDHLSSDELTTENVTIADLLDLLRSAKRQKRGGT